MMPEYPPSALARCALLYEGPLHAVAVRILNGDDEEAERIVASAIDCGVRTSTDLIELETTLLRLTRERATARRRSIVDEARTRAA